MKKIGLLLLTGIFCFNYSFSQNPFIASYDTHVLCPNEYSSKIAISNIVFGPSGGDSIYITSVQHPTSAFAGNSFENQFGQSFVSLATQNGGSTGVFDIEIYFKSTSSSIFSETIQVTVAGVPNITTNNASVCASENEFDLNTLVHPQGGSFYILPGDYRPENGLFNIDQYLLDFPNDNNFTYQYTIKDEYGCEFSSVNFTTVDLTLSPEISLLSKTNTTCTDNTGEIYTTVDSPNTSYDGYWSNGVQGVDNIVGLAPGDYYYTVTDNLGCKDQLTVIIETDGFDISGTVTDVACKGGSDGKINIGINGGSGNYKIEWSSGHASTNVTGLIAGIYMVKVIDLDNGCESHKSFIVSEPEEKFSVSYSYNDPYSCGSGDGAINIFGYEYGSTPYTYQWNNGATTESISGLDIGQYNVIVTDSKGCIAKYGVDLYHFNEMPPNSRLKHPTCGDNNGAIYITDFQYYSTQPITYSWSNGSTTRDITGLSAGVYTLEFDFGFGCPFVLTFDLVNTRFNHTPEICVVTVDTASNTNLVVWEKEVGNPHNISYYNIYRTDATTGGYQVIDTVHYNSISVYNDVYASPERRSWLYKISAVNSCGQESVISPHHKTIHLVMKDGSAQGEKILTWDHYEGLDYFHYNLSRGTDVDGWQLIQSGIPITALPIFSDTPPVEATEVDYIIEVVPTTGGCNPTMTKVQDYNSSRSNKPRPIFNPGHGAGDLTNSLMVLDNTGFKAIVYPNPSNGNFKIDIIENVNNESLKMTVLGLNGKTIHQQGLKNDLNTLHLNMEAGIYFIQIQGNSTHETIRIVIQ